MGVPRLIKLTLLTATLPILVPSTAHAQIFDRLKDAATDAAEDEMTNQVERVVRYGVACVFNDITCIERAQADGEDVYLTDEEGEPVVNEEGETVSDPGQAAEILGEDPPGTPGVQPGAGPGAVPGQGADANTDFVAGESTVLSVDYSEDNLGDFPRRFDLLTGSFDVIDWEGTRYVRALSGGVLAIVLPETLPEKFTLETSVSVQHGNAYFAITPGRAYRTRPRDYAGSSIEVRIHEAGVEAIKGTGPRAMGRHEREVVQNQVADLQVMADGEHMKVYLDGNRVANVPNAVFPRTDTLFVAVGSAAEAYPILMGPIRIAGSEVALYDRLARDGRVTTRGILFDVNSDMIQPESAETIDEIGTMLKEHPDLRIAIEGHTDSDGEEAFNRDLSERRAAAVKRQLIEDYGIEVSRLEAAGYGETRPVAPNDTPEGKQQNRRVELVRL